MRSRRILLIGTILVVVVASLAVSPRGSTIGPGAAAAAKKTCKMVTQTVNGKKRKVKVCKAATPKPKATATATPTPSLEEGMKVDVGGYRLFIKCVGQGSPTVVL